MGRILPAFVCLLLGLATPARADEILFASATLPQQGGRSGGLIAAHQWLGVRFTVTEPTRVSAIGGTLYTIDGGSLFGAIVSLSGPSALPQGAFEPAELVAVTAPYVPPPIGTEVALPLTAVLEPGTYGVIFGSGAYGASGLCSLAGSGSANLPGITWALYFFGSSGGGWRISGFNDKRFVVYGEVLPDTDDDLDGFFNRSDNCPLVANPDQLDTDGDRMGDACDPDDDDDGVPDGTDACPLVDPEGSDADSNGCVDDLRSLLDVVGVVPVDPQAAQPLQAKVAAALRLAQGGDVKAARGALRALLLHIRAQAGKAIPESTAGLLTAYVENVLSGL